MKITKPNFNPQLAAERLAYWFYAVAALGSSIGQIWAMAAAPIWPDTVPTWIRVAAVAPFAIVIDLAGVVTSAFADARRRLGESAYGWRILSVFSVAVAVGINIAGHLDAIQYAVAFGFLGVLAYTIWLLHSGARRRDALRAQNKLAGTAPVYGPWQWVTEFETTRLARQLAVSQGLGLHESLQAAREHIRIRTRNQAFANRIETLVRAMHNDPIRAEIAVTGMNLDDIANTTANLIDNNAWAAYIAHDLNPPPAATDTPETAADERPAPQTTVVIGPEVPGSDVLRRIPATPAGYAKWRDLWASILADQTAEPEVSNDVLARRYGMDVRTIQWIRKVGVTGLLNSPLSPAQRLIQMAHDELATMASSNGNAPHQPLPV